jgi:hypothetical protein
MGLGEPHGDRIAKFTDIDPVEITLDQALVATGVSVYASTLPVSGQGHRPCVVMQFVGDDGLAIPPIVLLVTPAELAAFAPMIKAAADAALTNARTLS